MLIEKFKRERQATKGAFAHVDILHDTHLFDLKVLHNASARRRSRTNKSHQESPQPASGSAKNLRGSASHAKDFHRIGPRHPKWKELTAPDKMRNLCHVMDMGLRLQASSMVVPAVNSRARKEPAQAVNIDIETAPSPSSEQDLPKASPKAHDEKVKIHLDDMKTHFLDHIDDMKTKGKAQTMKSHQTPEMTRISIDLLEFILDRCKSLNEFFRALDVKGQGKGRISRKQWETALMALGYVSKSKEDDPSRFFRHLDVDQSGYLECEDVMEDLELHVPNLTKRRLDAVAGASRTATLERTLSSSSPRPVCSSPVESSPTPEEEENECMDASAAVLLGASIR